MSDSPMDRLRDIVLDAIGLPHERRAAYLDETCGANTELRRAAEELLSVDDTRVLGFQSAVRIEVDLVSTALLGSIDDEHADEFTNYRVREEIGRGGSSRVFRAEQTAPIAREVALKVLRVGRSDPSSRARFMSEQQMLGALEHSHIARVFDAGVTARGRHYFAMELVRGANIIEHCREKALDSRMRIGLFMQTCWGVEHAHRKGILHRDIKPSNVLVAEQAGRGVAKVIDFGIARTLELQADPNWTLAGHMLGTPQYMSPEQARGERHRVDVRSDVFSLGVILHELLTGAIPYDAPSDSVLAMLGTVSRGEVSVRTIDHNGGRLPADLVAILRTAIHVDPESRYESPAALAQDLSDFLHSRPVRARRGGVMYTTSKWISRHRLATTIGIAFLLTLVSSAILSSTLYFRAESQTRIARQQAETSTRLLEHLQNMYLSAGPLRENPDISLREALDLARERVRSDLDGHSNVKAELLLTISEIEKNLGLLADALRTLESAEQALQGLDGLEVRGLRARIRQRLGNTLVESGMTAEGRGVLRDILLEVDRGEFLARDRMEVEAGACWSLALAEAPHDPEHAHALLDRGERAIEAMGGDQRHLQLTSQNVRGHVYRAQNDLKEARALWERTLEGYAEILGPEHQLTVDVVSSLASVEFHVGDRERGIEMLRGALERTIANLGNGHHSVAAKANNLGVQLLEDGRIAEAIPLLEQSRVIWADKLPPGHPHLGAAHNNVAFAHQMVGEYDLARVAYLSAIAIEDSLVEPRPLQIALYLTNAGINEHRRGAWEEAEAYFRRAIETVSMHFDDRHRQLGFTWSSLASLELDRGQVEQAEYAATIALSILNNSPSPIPDRLLLARSILARARFAAGDVDSSVARLRELNAELCDGSTVPEWRRYELERIATILSAVGDHDTANRCREASATLLTRARKVGR